MIIHRIRDRLVWEPSARAVVSPPPSLSDQSVLEQHWPRGSAFVGRDSAYQHDIDYVGVSIERPMFPFFIFPIFLSFSFFFFANLHVFNKHLFFLFLHNSDHYYFYHCFYYYYHKYCSYCYNYWRYTLNLA